MPTQKHSRPGLSEQKVSFYALTAKGRAELTSTTKQPRHFSQAIGLILEQQKET